MEKVIVLLSCMHQKDFSIIKRVNIQTDAVIINQCDINTVEILHITNSKGINCEIRFISTTDRGISLSRNMAMDNVRFDSAICLLCDEDEILCDGYEDLIIEGYQKLAHPDMVAFKVDWSSFGKRYPAKYHKLSFINVLKICSVQISFNIANVRKKEIRFDPCMGSGTGNGAGEENKFMMDCRRMGLSQFYYPNKIAIIHQGESQWFKGFTKTYFINMGWSSRRIFQNSFLAILYTLYYAICKYKLYKNDCSFYIAISSMIKGVFFKK